MMCYGISLHWLLHGLYQHLQQMKKATVTTKCPPLQVISMAMWTHWSNTCSITRCTMSRAITEATGCDHQVTTNSVLPQWLPGQQANKQWWKNTPTFLAFLVAMAMCRYFTARIAQWRRSSFTRSHWLLPLGKYYVQQQKRDIPTPVFINVFHCQHVENGCKAKGWPQLTISSSLGNAKNYR